MTDAERGLLLAVARLVTDAGLGFEGDRQMIDKMRSAVLLEISYRNAKIETAPSFPNSLAGD